MRQRQAVRAWLHHCAQQEGATIAHLNYLFCSDTYMLEANNRFLQHNYLTDIITFPDHSSKGIAGDLLISIDRIRENAKDLKESPRRELLRVMAHGALHLIGYDDKTPEHKQAMRAAEDRWISNWHTTAP